jgi:hypothetical protein
MGAASVLIAGLLSACQGAGEQTVETASRATKPTESAGTPTTSLLEARDGDEDEPFGGREAAPEAAWPKPIIREYRASGDLCPPGAFAWNVATARDSIAPFIFPNVSAVDSSIERSCRLTLGIEVPADYSFGRPDFLWSASASVGVEFTTAYAFAGGESVAPRRRTVDEEDPQFIDTDVNLWSSSCADAARPQRVELVIDVSAKVPRDGYLSQLSFDVGFGYENGTQWRLCGSDVPLAPQAVAEGGKCSIVPNFPCASGLACDLSDNRQKAQTAPNTGVCVDPDEQVPARAKDEACGGARRVRCSDGLVCHYSSAARAADGIVGVCTDKAPELEQRCGGYPALVCADGLYCGTLSRASDAKYCQAKGGNVDDRCGPGLADCGPGLECNGEKCTQKLAARGEPCGDGVAKCGHLDRCDSLSQRCVPSASAGQRGAHCIADSECNDGLACVLSYCREPYSGELGAPCESTIHCDTGLSCRANVCAEPADVGDSCRQSDDCSANLSCVMQQCVRLLRGEPGAMCDRDSECDSRACVSGLCAEAEELETAERDEVAQRETR